jgi:sugar/nucleoside kinase (ribokinase family)
MTTSVDVASAGPIADAGVERFLSWVSGIDVMLANESEAALLAGLPVPDPAEEPSDDTVASARRAAEILAGMVGTVVVKLGPRGALLHTSEGVTAHTEGIPVDVVDTTGAGDAFASGFLPAWAAGRDPATALGLGNRSAVRVVARVGARP